MDGRTLALGAERLSEGRVDLGAVEAVSSFPARMEIEGIAYFLVREGDQYRLLSSVCPHLGSEVADGGDCFACPSHGWKFDRGTGECVTSPGERMGSFAVEVVEGRWIAALPSRGNRARANGEGGRLGLVKDLTISLHAHACLEIRHRGFSLLTDPWLVGPAFLGAWTHYPPSLVDVEALRPDAICISHEHSDHFHEPTLARFDRELPIYVPDFPNRRMVERLEYLGFKRAVAMRFGEKRDIGGGMRITFYEPGSLWNDAVVLIEVDGLRFLSLNDAGLNRRIASAVGPVDVIASSFSPGASGYPLTWTHLNDEQKAEIIERSRQGLLHMLKESVQMYGGQVVLPFAGHFALWHPAHEGYQRAMHKNTVDDVARAFEGSEARVVDLLPGESWDVEQDRIDRKWKRRERLYEADRVVEYLRRKFDQRVFGEHHPEKREVARADIEKYFLGLNRTAEIGFCENLSFVVRAMEGGEEVGFEIVNGELRVLPGTVESPNVTIEIPAGVLHRIVTENLSWDEAHIGYWCRFSREPDVFHAGFWRLLQSPYLAKAAVAPSGNRKEGSISEDWVLADVIEKFGERADRIIRRYGLYCAGCQHSTADTLAQGGRQHGLDERRVQRMVRELNETLMP